MTRRLTQPAAGPSRRPADPARGGGARAPERGRHAPVRDDPADAPPPRRPPGRHHQRHGVPHRRAARAGGPGRRGRRRPRRQSTRAHHLHADGCRSRRRAGMGAPRAAPGRSSGRVPRRARRGAQPRPRRRCSHCSRARRTALADAHAALVEGHRAALGKGVPEQYLLEIAREEALLQAELALDGRDPPADRATPTSPGAPTRARQNATRERRTPVTDATTGRNGDDARAGAASGTAASHPPTAPTPPDTSAARGRRSGRSSSGSS